MVNRLQLLPGTGSVVPLRSDAHAVTLIRWYGVFLGGVMMIPARAMWPGGRDPGAMPRAEGERDVCGRRTAVVRHYEGEGDVARPRCTSQPADHEAAHAQV